VSRLDFAFRAREDLQQIYDYIGEDDPLAALRVIERIQTRAQALADSPGIGSMHDELVANMRSVAEGNYLIFYFALYDGIEVARVLHAKRDLKKVFKGLK
jgi:toxin ParE1/3/4